MEWLWIFIGFLISAACGILTASLMDQKGKSGVGGFFLGFFLNIFGLLYAAGLPTDRAALNKLMLGKDQYGKCSACCEVVDMSASVCPYCRSKLSTRS